MTCKHRRARSRGIDLPSHDTAKRPSLIHPHPLAVQGEDRLQRVARSDISGKVKAQPFPAYGRSPRSLSLSSPPRPSASESAAAGGRPARAPRDERSRSGFPLPPARASSGLDLPRSCQRQRKSSSGSPHRSFCNRPLRRRKRRRATALPLDGHAGTADTDRRTLPGHNTSPLTVVFLEHHRNFEFIDLDFHSSILINAIQAWL